jgi:hypothetical protein
VKRASHCHELAVKSFRLAFDDLLGAWVPLAIALNALNRSMRLADPYPFVMPEPAVQKLGLVHQVIEASSMQ